MSPRTLIFAMVLGLLLNGCAARRTAGNIDRSVMREVLLDAVPIGSNVKDAEAFMVSEGFACEIKRNARFVERRDDASVSGNHLTHEGIDFLECNRSEMAHLLIERKWHAAFVLDGETVRDVIVNLYLTGP